PPARPPPRHLDRRSGSCRPLPPRSRGPLPALLRPCRHHGQIAAAGRPDPCRHLRLCRRRLCALTSLGARIRRPAVDRRPAVHHRSLRRPPRRGSRLDRRTPAGPHPAPEPAHRVDRGRCRNRTPAVRHHRRHPADAAGGRPRHRGAPRDRPRTASPVAAGSDRVPRLAMAVGPGPRTGSCPDHARTDAGPGTGSDLPAGRRVPRADRHVVAGGPSCRDRHRFVAARCPPALRPLLVLPMLVLAVFTLIEARRELPRLVWAVGLYLSGPVLAALQVHLPAQTGPFHLIGSYPAAGLTHVSLGSILLLGLGADRTAAGRSGSGRMPMRGLVALVAVAAVGLMAIGAGRATASPDAVAASEDSAVPALAGDRAEGDSGARTLRLDNVDGEVLSTLIASADGTVLGTSTVSAAETVGGWPWQRR